ncbi:MAG: alpha-L-fucosidase [Planctomycetota bacterium]
MADARPPADLPTPLPRQRVWQDCEVGAIFHFDMPLFGDRGWNHRDAIHKTWDPQRYNPTRLDTDQWAATAKAMGARYAIVTATHFNGFLQWQSDLYPYGVRQAPWREGKGDLVGDFVESCRQADIKPGVYLSCFRNAWWKVDRYRVNYGKGGERQAAFARTCERMVEELCSRYGPLVQIWFDAGLIAPADGGPDVLPIVDQHQPHMVFYHSPQRREHRWIGNEAGHAGYPCWATMPALESAERAHKGRLPGWRKLLAHGDPDGSLWSPAMVDTVLRDHHWFWKPKTEGSIESLKRLVGFYYQSVGRNCNLVLGLTPAPDGLVPAPDVRRCEEFGREIRRRFAQPVAETQGEGSEVVLALPETGRIDHVVATEDIAGGERVRAYVVEGRVPSGQWAKLCEGVSIGHKRIQRFDPVEVAAVRLRITEVVGPPTIRRLAVFCTTEG